MYLFVLAWGNMVSSSRAHKISDVRFSVCTVSMILTAHTNCMGELVERRSEDNGDSDSTCIKKPFVLSCMSCGCGKSQRRHKVDRPVSNLLAIHPVEQSLQM